ncbi:putative uncharacterized protein [Waddlia chondrophila 2032/99]|uniref:J domain-containing protein n=2 Tax=Waddlia chondrophila TaxID=71667 RepID=D6YTY8_WADCW|nr:hypothetical protein [Waddlia chondrophila]ADI37599.1 hypothetical protein wcw_0224 [Waddlia chondrophila WSU 86-1044]CCB91054.1 putative uncharacterized protein [Waddlia chondrophila 2032/99]
MNIEFKKNAYLESIKKEDYLNSEEKIFDYAKNNLQFNYGNVGFREFNDTYASVEGWLGRKVIALPVFFCLGVVKTINHFATIILQGIVYGTLAGAIRVGAIKIELNNQKVAPSLLTSLFLSVVFERFKKESFYLVRDLQEAFGWLATIFSDRYGQYHVQESQFHKSCYGCESADDSSENYSVLGLKAQDLKGLDSETLEKKVNHEYRRHSLKHHPDKIYRKSDESKADFEKRKQEQVERFIKLQDARDGILNQKETSKDVNYNISFFGRSVMSSAT